MIELSDKIAELVNEKIAAEESLEGLFLVEVKHLPNNMVQVFVDSDEAVLFGHCTKLSRYLEEHIEENEWLGEKYTLEVSSPGVGTPLKLKRQYVKNIGRIVNVQVEDDHKHTEGTLTAVEDEHIVVSYTEKVRVKGRKKKEKVEIHKEIPFSNIIKTVVKISFR